jgi:hypothetical protein
VAAHLTALRQVRLNRCGWLCAHVCGLCACSLVRAVSWTRIHSHPSTNPPSSHVIQPHPQPQSCCHPWIGGGRLAAGQLLGRGGPRQSMKQVGDCVKSFRSARRPSNHPSDHPSNRPTVQPMTHQIMAGLVTKALDDYDQAVGATMGSRIIKVGLVHGYIHSQIWFGSSRPLYQPLPLRAHVMWLGIKHPYLNTHHMNAPHRPPCRTGATAPPPAATCRSCSMRSGGSPRWRDRWTSEVRSDWIGLD